MTWGNDAEIQLPVVSDIVTLFKMINRLLFSLKLLHECCVLDHFLVKYNTTQVEDSRADYFGAVPSSALMGCPCKHNVNPMYMLA